MQKKDDKKKKVKAASKKGQFPVQGYTPATGLTFENRYASA